jgi:cyanophycinase
MKQLFIPFIFFVSAYTIAGQSIQDTSLNGSTGIFVGPEKGYLVLGGTTWEDSALLKAFVSLAGTKPNVIIIPTGLMRDSEIINENEAFFIDIKKAFMLAGAGDVHFLHTRDATKANSTEFLSKIKAVNAVWFTGGDVRVLVETYLKSKVINELKNLLNRGGVVGGNSAGANAMGTYFIKADTSTTEAVFQKNDYAFNFIKNSCVIPHLLTNNRQFQYFDFKKGHNSDLLGIGIDHNAFVIIHKNELEVRGSTYVAIYDGTFQSNRRKNSLDILPNNSERFYVLYGGAKYDLLKRRVIQFFRQ